MLQSRVGDLDGLRFRSRRWTASAPRSAICCGPAISRRPARPQALDLFGVELSHRRARPRRRLSGRLRRRRRDAGPCPPPRRLTLAALAPYGPLGERPRRRLRRLGRARCRAVEAAPTRGPIFRRRRRLQLQPSADAGAARRARPTAIVPQDLAQAALELAAERFRAAEHIGVRSKSLGGQETIAYDVSRRSRPRCWR